MGNAFTQGIHHLGLTVQHLEDSAAFFTGILGWKEVMRKEDYPAIFVSDGNIMLTLWATKSEPVVAFDKNSNVGLHHVAFRVKSEDHLNQLYETLLKNKISVEFSPEMLGQGPARHMMCHEPSGNRIECVWPGQ